MELEDISLITSRQSMTHNVKYFGKHKLTAKKLAALWILCYIEHKEGHLR